MAARNLLLFYQKRRSKALQSLPTTCARNLPAANLPTRELMTPTEKSQCPWVSPNISSVKPTEELIERADGLLYKAKQEGRNRICAALAQLGFKKAR
jgi:GGDEF domain-containing protein